MLSMKQHQKYFPLLDPASREARRRAFSSYPICRRTIPRDIVHGNERVLRARLSDAKFFYDQDRKTRLEDARPAARERRLSQQARHPARARRARAAARGRVRARARHRLRSAERAAWLSKADLLTDMVGEFPELQGIMGRYYALHDGEPQRVADAIEAHYRPRYAATRCPNRTSACAVALADKLETLAGLFGIGQQPTRRQGPVRPAPPGARRDSHPRRARASARALDARRRGVRRFRRVATSSRPAQSRARCRSSSTACAATSPKAGYSASEVDAVLALEARAHRPRSAPARSGEDVQHAARSAEPRRGQQAHRQHPQESRRRCLPQFDAGLLVEAAGKGARRGVRRPRARGRRALRGAGLHRHAEDARRAARRPSMLSSTA